MDANTTAIIIAIIGALTGIGGVMRQIVLDWRKAKQDKIKKENEEQARRDELDQALRKMALDQINPLSDRLSEALECLGQYDKDIQELRRQVINRDDQIIELRRELSSLKKTLSDRDRIIVGLRKDVQTLTIANQQKDEQILALQNEIVLKDSQVASLSKRLEAVEKTQV